MNALTQKSTEHEEYIDFCQSRYDRQLLQARVLDADAKTCEIFGNHEGAKRLRVQADNKRTAVAKAAQSVSNRLKRMASA